MDIICTCTCPFNGAFSLWLSFIKLQVKHALDRKIPKTPKGKHSPQIEEDRQHNGQTIYDKRTNNDKQHITQKTKD